VSDTVKFAFKIRGALIEGMPMRLPYRFGRYILLKKLATGGMAEIYRAKYIGEGGFEKWVAIKRLLPVWSSDRDFIMMLIDEAKALVHLQHKNIVQVLELGKEEESFFISMELIDGLDLGCFFSHILKNNIAIPLKHKIYILCQILEALDFAHRQAGTDGKSLNIVHRDVSPQNVLLSWNGDVKVADFGIAKGTHRSYETTVTQVKGKYSYMSPEQASGKPVDQRTDIYAAGILLYELLSCRRLYDAPNDLEVIELVKKSRLPLKPLEGIEPGLKKIMLRALERDMEKRYQTAALFLADLNQYAMKRGLLTTGLEFGQFLRKTFPSEVERHEEENAVQYKIGTAAKQKTRPFGKVTQFGLRLGRAGISVRSGMMATIIACLFLPWTPQAGRLVAPASAPVEEKKLISHAIDIKPSNSDAISKKAKEELQTALINVHARPWGYVTIPGYASQRETPVQNLKVTPGNHLVKVYYEPANQWVSAKIETKSAVTTNCLAIFGEYPSIKCK